MMEQCTCLVAALGRKLQVSEYRLTYFHVLPKMKALRCLTCVSSHFIFKTKGATDKRHVFWNQQVFPVDYSIEKGAEATVDNGVVPETFLRTSSAG